MKKSVNFGGAVIKSSKKGFSPESLIETLRKLGMTDDEIKRELENLNNSSANSKNCREFVQTITERG